MPTHSAFTGFRPCQTPFTISQTAQVPVRGGGEIRRSRLHPPSSNFGLRCASTRRVGASRRRTMKRILHLNLRRKFFAVAASIPSCCRCESAIWDWIVCWFESHQVFTPLQLASAMVKFDTSCLDGRTVKQNQISNDTLPGAGFSATAWLTLAWPPGNQHEQVQPIPFAHVQRRQCPAAHAGVPPHPVVDLAAGRGAGSGIHRLLAARENGGRHQTADRRHAPDHPERQQRGAPFVVGHHENGRGKPRGGRPRARTRRRSD